MKESLRAWWASVEGSEKRGLIVLGAFLAGAFFLVAGIKIGASVSPLL